MVTPSRMCRKHLLGEHVEGHMLAACLRLGNHDAANNKPTKENGK
jgi:hypothetical protein